MALTSGQRAKALLERRRKGRHQPPQGSAKRKLSTKTLRPDRPPWEILDTETSANYEAFKTYRDMSPMDRNIPDVAKIFGVNPPTLHQLSSLFNWAARASAWDYHIESARLELTEQYQLDMFKRHAEVCVMLVEKVKQRVEKLQPKELKPRDVAQWIDVATKIERISRGAANERTAESLIAINKQVENMSKLTDEDLEKIISREKIRRMKRDAIDVSGTHQITEGNPSA